MPDRINDNQNPPSDGQSVAHAPGKKKKRYDVSFFYAWCKACGICEAFCPGKIIKTNKAGIPEIIDADGCSGCRFCEKHCPDFAITVEERMPRRRKTDG